MVILPITVGSCWPLQKAILPQQQVQHNIYVQAAWHFRPLDTFGSVFVMIYGHSLYMSSITLQNGILAFTYVYIYIYMYTCLDCFFVSARHIHTQTRMRLPSHFALASVRRPVEGKESDSGSLPPLTADNFFDPRRWACNKLGLNSIQTPAAITTKCFCQRR